MATDLTFALAGHAPNSVENVEHNLIDWLRLPAPDRDGYYEKPDAWRTITIYWILTDGQVPKGLQAAMDLTAVIDPATIHLVTDDAGGRVARWAEQADSVIEARDPFERLITELADAPSSQLFINWDEHDPDDEQLIRLAHQHPRIQVRNLVEGLGEILPDEDEPSKEDPEDHVEESPPPRRRRRASQQPPLDELNEQPEDLDEEASREEGHSPSTPPQEPSSVEEEVAAAKRGAAQSTIAVGPVEVSSDYLRDLVRTVDRAALYMRALDAQNAAKNLSESTQYSPLTSALCDGVESLNKLLNPELAYEETVAKPIKPKPNSGKSVRVIWDDDENKWKKAGRGRTRAGVRVGYMNPDGHVTEAA